LQRQQAEVWISVLCFRLLAQPDAFQCVHFLGVYL